MAFLIKLLFSVAIIILCSQIGRKFPSLAGLFASMPSVSVIILVWLYHDSDGDHAMMAKFVKGILWGMIPSLCFFLTAYFCFKRQWTLPITLSLSFGVWFVGALVHQWFLK